MDAVDRMLAELKAKYKPAEEPASDAIAKSATEPSSPATPALQSLDELLQTINASTRRAVRASLSTTVVLHSQPTKPTPTPKSELAPSRPQPTISLTDAHNWLKQLKPTTEEGLWFEEFAFHYPSRLEAAIDYLTALRNAA